MELKNTYREETHKDCLYIYNKNDTLTHSAVDM
jgi:hypothetical protein